MAEELFSIIFFFIIIGTPFCGAQECEYWYTDGRYDAACDKIVHQFPSRFYGNWDKLLCRDCQIPTFDKQTFTYGNNLNTFNVSHSGIQSIGERSFTFLSNLKYLFLQNNALTNISRGAFQGLNKLSELHLENNRLKTVEAGFLEGISSRFINISENLLEFLPPKAFQGSVSILALDLSRNELNKLDKDAFEGLKDLKELDLRSNSLCHLPLGIFKSFPTLRRLNLANNKISRINNYGTFSGLKNLEFLILAQNNLNVFDSTALFTMMHLTKLDISGNAIFFYTFDVNEILLNVPTLKVISLEDNIFSCTLLRNLLQFFKEKQIEVENNESRFEHLNINGIACTEDDNIESVSFHSFLKKSRGEADMLVSYC